jgi:hypothetical protein
MAKKETPQSYETLERKGEGKRILTLILAQTKKRGEVWLYPTLEAEEYIPIWICGDHWRLFLFEASSKRYQEQLKSQEEGIIETAKDMLLAGEFATLEEVIGKTPAFIAKHYRKIRGLPIRFFPSRSEMMDYKKGDDKLKSNASGC